MVGLKGDYQLDTMTLWIWKMDTHSSICRTSNNIGDGSVLQMDKLLSEVLIHLDKCSQSKSNTSEANNLQIYFFKNDCFLGLRISIALVHAFVTRIFIIKASCIHVCLKTLLFMNGLLQDIHFNSIYFKANFIRLALHSCMFKNTTFHEWAFFHKIFISFPNTLY